MPAGRKARTGKQKEEKTGKNGELGQPERVKGKGKTGGGGEI